MRDPPSELQLALMLSTAIYDGGGSEKTTHTNPQFLLFLTIMYRTDSVFFSLSFFLSYRLRVTTVVNQNGIRISPTPFVLSVHKTASAYELKNLDPDMHGPERSRSTSA